MARYAKEITLALLKPDLAINTKLVAKVTGIIEKNGFEIIRKKTVRWNKFDAEKFYEVHKGRFFYPRLVDYMSSGPIVAMVLSKQDAIKEWRTLMGPTKTYQTRHIEPNSLRGMFGLTDTRNTTHGSDSPQTAHEEVQFFFPNFEVQEEEDHGKLKAKNSHQSLGLRSTWEDYYGNQQSSDAVDWFLHYDDIKDDISRILQDISHPKVLDLGCGNSPLAINIAENHPDADVYCGDISTEALDQMIIAASNCEKRISNFHCIHMDATKLIPLDDVNLIIDKGTSDAVMRQPSGEMIVENLLTNALSSLCIGGEFIQISDEDPDFRMTLLQKSTDKLNGDFQISCKEVTAKSNSMKYFSYSIRKL